MFKNNELSITDTSNIESRSKTQFQNISINKNDSDNKNDENNDENKDKEEKNQKKEEFKI